ncbi:MAG TPA: hypothetical protein VJ482_01060 [Acidimicrobiia bacterium]|nr:hypothetical protein [Acidimicrobiia bacterium]
MEAFHTTLGWVAVSIVGLAGLFGIGSAIAKRPPTKAFWVVAGAGMGAMVVQVLAGIVLYLQDDDPGAFHMFYGFLVLFSLAFAYMYRSQLAKRPALAWGLLLLFVMGLGLRAIMTFEGS